MPVQRQPQKPAGQAPAPFHWAERAACRYLQAQGLRLLASNYRLRGAELDLVMAEGNTVVVIEVKQRKSSAYGHPAESIDGRKLARMRAAAQHYVSFVLRRDAAVRFDAVVLLGTEQRYDLQHLRNVG